MINLLKKWVAAIVFAANTGATGAALACEQPGGGCGQQPPSNGAPPVTVTTPVTVNTPVQVNNPVTVTTPVTVEGSTTESNSSAVSNSSSQANSTGGSVGNVSNTTVFEGTKIPKATMHLGLGGAQAGVNYTPSLTGCHYSNGYTINVLSAVAGSEYKVDFDRDCVEAERVSRERQQEARILFSTESEKRKYEHETIMAMLKNPATVSFGIRVAAKAHDKTVGAALIELKKDIDNCQYGTPNDPVAAAAGGCNDAPKVEAPVAAAPVVVPAATPAKPAGKATQAHKKAAGTPAAANTSNACVLYEKDTKKKALEVAKSMGLNSCQ